MISKLQISDLHLGDLRSVLSNQEVAHSVVKQIAALSGGKIGKLIIAGDSWEECVPGDMTKLCEGIAYSVYQDSANFYGALFREVEIDEVVLVPGNHDLSTWDWYCQAHSLSAVTEYRGRLVDAKDWPWQHLLPGLLSKLTVSYPVYCDKKDYPIHVVTHGHMLDPLVLGWNSAVEYDALEVLGCSRPGVSTVPSDVKSFKNLANLTNDFVLKLWKRYSPRDYVYSNYLMRRFLHPQSCVLQPAYKVDGYYSLDASMLTADFPPVSQGYESNLPWMLELAITDPYLPSPIGSLANAPSCLTFGHDHLGYVKNVVSCGVPFLCADSGGWTSEHPGHEPHTHVLVWEKPEDVVPQPYFIRARTTEGKLL